MKAEVKIRPFTFPNFLKLDDGRERGAQIPVATLSPEAASELWDDMKAAWLAHVAKKKQEADRGSIDDEV